MAAYRSRSQVTSHRVDPDQSPVVHRVGGEDCQEREYISVAVHQESPFVGVVVLAENTGEKDIGDNMVVGRAYSVFGQNDSGSGLICSVGGHLVVMDEATEYERAAACVAVYFGWGEFFLFCRCQI